MTDVERPLMYIIYGSVGMLCMRLVGEGAWKPGITPYVELQLQGVD